MTTEDKNELRLQLIEQLTKARDVARVVSPTAAQNIGMVITELRDEAAQVLLDRELQRRREMPESVSL